MRKMNGSEYALFICGFVPLIFVLSMLLYIGIARVQLGYWPTYGTQPDPSAFGFLPLKLIGFVGFLLSPIFVVGWVGALVSGYAIYGNKFRINKLSFCCFLSGTIIFFVMKYCFTPYFAWYFD